MSCELGWDGSSSDIAAAFLEGPAPARRLVSGPACFWWTSASVQPGDGADEAERNGASQLIARLNGKRSPACQPSALWFRRASAGPRPRA